jgi:putative transposon-encoded protein
MYSEEAMVTRERKRRPKECDGRKNDNDASARTEFRVFGEEMIEKRVKTSGRSGRVYLPGDWVGKQVKIIRID